MNQPNQQNLSEKPKTILAYRPDGQDTCRGCLMGSSSSDFQILTTYDHREFIEFWLDKLKNQWEMKGDRAYCNWEIHVIDPEGEHHDVSDRTDATYLDQPLKGWLEEVVGRFNKWKIVETEHLRVKAMDSEQAKKYKVEQEERQRLAELLAKYPGALN